MQATSVLSLGCLLLTATALHAQDASPVLLGTPAIDVVAGAAESTVPESSAAVRPSAGLSGEIRMVLSPSSATLDPRGLSVFGNGWEKGHRWVRIDGGGGARGVGPAPSLLGEPVVPPPEYVLAPMVTPEQPGSWRLESAEGDTLTIVTRVPASMQRGRMLNGYHIGIYPNASSVAGDAYVPPEAFIEITPENQDLHVSRHLQLRQFLTKDQFDVWPKYLALDLRLIDKLELVIKELNAMGIRADRIHVMSGFRTPQYNGPGGDGRATLSRHMWGDAADVWIDNDGNGYMDDLNGDGLIDLDDAAVMMRAVERVEAKYPELIGGAGTYPTTDTHGPYIHIDARGQRSRW